MARHQRPRFERELALDDGALVPDAADDVVVGDFRDVDGLTAAQQLADGRGLGLGVGLRAAGPRQVAVDVGELLAGDGHVVGPGEQAGLRAILLALVVGLGQLRAQVGDLRRQRLGGRLRHRPLRLGLRLDIEFRDLVGCARGERRIAAGELDGDDAGLRRREHHELLQEGLHDARIRRIAGRVMREAEQDHRPLQGPESARQRIEFVVPLQAEGLDRAAGDVGRADQLHLAGDRRLVELRCRVRRQVHPVGAREEGFLVFEQDLRLCRVARRHHVHEDRDEHEGDERRQQIEATAPLQRPADGAHVDFAGGL